MAALKYRKHQVLDGFTAFILCTKMSLCNIEEKIKKYPQSPLFSYDIRNFIYSDSHCVRRVRSCNFMNASKIETCVFIQT